MTFLPIVGRELRVASRQRNTYWIRTGAALGGIAIGAWIMLMPFFHDNRTLGPALFVSLSILTFAYSLLIGVLRTADCLSQEKRGGTLGLLFLTDLKGYDIVLGKLAATSLNGFYGLLAVFPVMAVPILLGGITQGEFWRAALVLANTFLFSLAVGIFVSALSREARRAMGANLLVLLLITGIPGACAGLGAYLIPSHRFEPEFLLSCPVYTLWLCDESVYMFRQSDFWWSVGLIHGLTWI